VDNIPQPIVDMQEGTYAYATIFGEPTAATVDFWPVIQATPPTTGDINLSALQNLFTSIPQMADYQKLVNNPGEFGDFEEHEISAFCMNFSEIGSSALSIGGLATTSYSERFIQRPILSKFSPYQGAPNDFRAAWEYHKTGGSAVYLAGRSMEFLSKFDYNNKVAPFFRFYNFDEYWIQLNLILAGALSN
jgi:hypothetical protein